MAIHRCIFFVNAARIFSQNATRIGPRRGLSVIIKHKYRRRVNSQMYNNVSLGLDVGLLVE